jgi:2-amino-4-hydroxy-6-hydroxymethyldihydropteridine diphosphokinase
MCSACEGRAWKPDATIPMRQNEVALSIGSNLGNRLAALAEARRRALAIPRVAFVAHSRVYETEPVGVRPEHRTQWFLNAVLLVTSDLSPDDLLHGIHRIETDMGRARASDRNAPRPVDIDIVYIGDQVIRSPSLRVPHPRWRERRFVVQPLADVRPDDVLPGERLTVREILDRLPDAPVARLYAEAW